MSLLPHLAQVPDLRQETTYQVRSSVSGLRQWLPRLGFPDARTTPVPGEASAEAPNAFLQVLAGLEAKGDAGRVLLSYAAAAPPTHQTRCPRAWCQAGKERPLLPVRGRERAVGALKAYAPPQVLLDETERVVALSTRRLYEQLGATRRRGHALRRVRPCPLLPEPGTGPHAHSAGVAAAVIAPPEAARALVQVAAPEDHPLLLPPQRPVPPSRARLL